MRRCLFGLAVGLLLVPANTQASSILVNGGFELGPAMDGPLCPISPAACQDVDVVAGLGVIPGWDVFGDSIDYLGPPWNVSDGFHAVDLDGSVALFSGVSQTFATKVGKEYDVFFDLSGNPEDDPLEKTVRVIVDGFSQNYTFDSSGQSINDLVWGSIAFSFVASGSSATLSPGRRCDDLAVYLFRGGERRQVLVNHFGHGLQLTLHLRRSSGFPKRC
jgi:hypothetical protein